MSVSTPSGQPKHMQTATVDGNLNPEYTDAAFEFTLSSADFVPGETDGTMTFEVWDENNISDDLMGQSHSLLSELQVTVLQMSETSDASTLPAWHEETIALKGSDPSDKGEYGTIRVSVLRETTQKRSARIAQEAQIKAKEQADKAAAEAELQKQLNELVAQKEFYTVTVVKCSNLKDLETMSTSDPYVKLMLQPPGVQPPGGAVQEFKTAFKDGELNPEYGEVTRAVPTVGEI